MIDLAKTPTHYRELEGELDTIRAGKGSYLFTDTRELLDMSGGPCVTNLGHSNPVVIEAITNQLKSVPYVYSGFWANEPAEKLGALIKEEFDATWPDWFGKVVFACAGNEAVGFGCRVAAQYWIERGQPRHRFACREYSFHGVGLLTSALTDDYGRYMLMTPYYQPARDAYLLRVPGLGPGVDERLALARTRALIEASFADGAPIAGLVLETVGGPPVGAFAPSRDYLLKLREICDKLDILLIFDEVLCGSGRCGALSAAQRYDVRPDILILGKGITSGYIPLSAIVISEKVMRPMRNGSKVMMVGTTYTDHATACAAGYATLKFLHDNELYYETARNGDQLLKRLTKALEGVPSVHGTQGLGYLWGIHLRNPATGRAYEPGLQAHKKARDALYKAGIVSYSKGQTMGGVEDFVILAPPLTTPYDTLERAIDTVAEVLHRLELPA